MSGPSSSRAAPMPAGVAAPAKGRAREVARRRPAVVERAAQTRLAAFGAALAESGCLAAMLLVPVFFNIHSERIFEEDKVPLLRSLALVALLGLTIRIVERGRGALRVRGISLWQVPLVLPAGFLAAAYVLATIGSVNPRLSLLGAYMRQQGLYTWLCYPLLFVAVILIVRERRQVERFITAMMLAGGVAALHALLQQLGYDPLPWGPAFEGRPYGPAGNPIFLAAFLILTIPITVIWTLRTATGPLPRSRWPRTARWTAVFVGCLLLSVQVVSVMSAGSRGPVVGLVAAFLLLGLVHSAARGWRRLTLAVLGVALVGALIAGALSFLTATGLTGASTGPARLMRLLDLQRGTGRVRVLIWQAASATFTSDPWRAVIGYGPETFLSVVNPHYPPELAYYESRRVLPDRAHSAPLDALITTGLVGCIAEVAFYVAFFHYAFQVLGLISGAGPRRTYLILSVLGAVVGAGFPWLADGSPRYSGVGLSLGLFAGLVLFLVVRSLYPLSEPVRRRQPEKVLVLALVAVVAGHLVETSVGIPLVATRLYLWISAGLVVALALRWQRPAVATLEDSVSNVLPWGPFVALVLIALTYDAYSPTYERAALQLFVRLLVPIWLVGAFVGVVQTGRLDRRALTHFALSSLVPWALATGAIVWWANRLPQSGPDALMTAARFGKSMSHLLSIVYVAVFATIGAAALIAVRRRTRNALPLTRRTWMLPVYGGLALGAAAAIAMTNLATSRADIINKQGRFYEGKKMNETAARMYEEALALRPHTDAYAANLGRVLSLEGSRLAPINGARADESLRRARAALERAYEIRPSHIDHPRNIARLHHLWATLLQNSEARAQQFAESDRWYERTLAIAPTHAAVLNEWALMHYELRDTERALGMLARSVEIDPWYTTTYWIRGNVRASTGDPEGALKDYDHALMLYDKLLPALSGKGAVLLQLGRIDDAIAVNRRALEINPKDFITRKNLAVLYRDKGALEDSLKHANQALTVAPKNEREALRQFIADVEARRAAAPSR